MFVRPALFWEHTERQRTFFSRGKKFEFQISQDQIVHFHYQITQTRQSHTWMLLLEICVLPTTYRTFFLYVPVIKNSVSTYIELAQYQNGIFIVFL